MDKSSTFSKSSNQLKDSLPVLLQKELELITQSLEFEKRESTYLDEQIKLLQYEISSIPRVHQSSLKELKTRIAMQEKKLELEISSLNNGKHKNKLLRNQINDYRLDKCAHKQSLLAITDNLDKTSRAADEQSQEIDKTAAEDMDQQDRIFSLRAKSANQRSQFGERISTLTSMLRNTGMGSKINYQEKQYAAQSIEVISVLKSGARGFQRRSVDKKRELDHYLKHLNSLRAGFDHIMLTTGINDIRDIVTSCIKGEEQNRLVLYYLNTLTAEIDVLQESFETNQEKIEILEKNKKSGQASIQEIKSINSKKIEKIKKKIKTEKEQTEKNSQIFQKILPLLKKLMSKTKSLNFKPVNSEKVETKGLEMINFETCAGLLGNVEEFIRFLIMVKELQCKKELSLHASPVKKRNEDRVSVKDIIDEKDLYDEPGLDEVRVPITLEDMRSKALMIFNKRRSVFKSKATTPEVNLSRTPTCRNHKEL
jgi:hypothetical protein